MKNFALVLAALASTHALAQVTTHATREEALKCDAGSIAIMSCVQNGEFRFTSDHFIPVTQPEYFVSFCHKTTGSSMKDFTLQAVERRPDGVYVRITAPFEMSVTDRGDDNGLYFEEARSSTPGEGSNWMEYQFASGDGSNYDYTINYLARSNDGQALELSGKRTFQCFPGIPVDVHSN